MAEDAQPPAFEPINNVQLASQTDSKILSVSVYCNEYYPPEYFPLFVSYLHALFTSIWLPLFSYIYSRCRLLAFLANPIVSNSSIRFLVCPTCPHRRLPATIRAVRHIF